MHPALTAKQNRILFCLVSGDRNHINKLISNKWLSTFEGTSAILMYLKQRVRTQDSYELCEYNYTAIKKYLLEHIQELIGTKNELFKLFFPEIYFAFAPLNEIQAETEPLFCFDEKEHNWYVNFLTFKKKNVFKSMLTNALHLENIVEFKENNWLSYDDYLKTMANRRLKSKFNHVEYPIFNSKQFKKQVFQLTDDQIYTFL